MAVLPVNANRGYKKGENQTHAWQYGGGSARIGKSPGS